MKTALVLLFVVSCVHAHGVMSKPLTRNDYLGYDAPTKNYNEGNPVGVSSTKFICQDQPDSDSKNWLSVTAGQTLTTLWGNGHPGDCFMYISYDGDKPNAEKKWFKIKEWANCGDLASKEQTFVIPSYLPSSSHAILRWEMYALHLRSAGTVEFYAACTDIKITGGAGANPTLPTPQVNIPGHLSGDATKYRDYGQTFLTGPPVASIGGTAYTATYTASPSQGGQTSQQQTSQQTSQQQTSQQQTSQRTSQQISSQQPSQQASSAASTDCISQCKQACGDASIDECSCANGLNVKCGSEAVSSASSAMLSLVPVVLYALV